MTENKNVPSEVAFLDAGTLAPIVGCALGRDRVGLGPWEWTRLHERNGGGVFRVSGMETESGRAWSLVLKVIPTDGDPSAVTYPTREPLAYASGLLDALPGGLAAPHCYRIDERIDGRVFLWLEDGADATPGSWPLARYEIAARHLVRSERGARE